MFKNVFSPAVKLMNRLKYKYKLGLVGAIFLVPILILSFLLVQRSVMIRSNRERSVLLAVPLIDTIQEHFGDFVDLQMILSIRQSDQEAHRKLVAAIESVRGDLVNLREIEFSGGEKQIWNQTLDAFESSFNEISNSTVTTSANPKEIFAIYAPVYAKIKSFYGTLSNLSGLINDPELEPFYLGNLLTQQIPDLVMLSHKARSYSRFAIAQGMLTSQTFDAMDSIVDELLSQEPLMQQRCQYALRQLKHSGKELDPLSKQAISSLNATTDYMLEQIIEAIDIQVDDATLSTKMEGFLASIQSFQSHTLTALEGRLSSRIHGQELALGMMVLLLLLIFMAALYFSFALMIAVNLTILKLTTAVESMAEGDMTVQADISTQDEMAHLRDGFNTMSRKINSLLLDVKETAQEVSDQAVQVEEISEQSSHFVEDQLGKTQFVEGKIDQLGESVNRVFGNTEEVAAAAQDALHLSDEGRQKVELAMDSTHALKDVINNSVEVTNRLSDQSQSISNIVDVIKGIAGQTNLLSLNAAIEAARAGEQGRGFAVVAEEVRSLSKRTQEATTEIEASILSLQAGATEAVQTMLASHEQVEATVEENSKVGEALTRITQAVEGIAMRNSENEQATADQRMVAGEIESNVAKISQSANETAEGARQTVSASRKMAHLAEKLLEATRSFVV